MILLWFLYKFLPLTWDGELSKDEKVLNKKRLKCIEKNHFWFAKSDTLNDPYDCKPFYKDIQSLEDIERILNDLEEDEFEFILQKFPNSESRDDILSLFAKILGSSKTQNSVKNLTKHILQKFALLVVTAKIRNVGILSLTTNYSSCLMWAHYAKNHEGICLEIHIPNDTKSLDDVKYVEKQPVIAIHEAMNKKHGKFQEIFYTKSKMWKKEEEWRMVARKGDEAKPIPNTSITKIIFGINTSESTKSKVSEYISDDISTHQMKLKKNYVLEF
jgi:hypothetical protein